MGCTTYASCLIVCLRVFFFVSDFLVEVTLSLSTEASLNLKL